MSPPEDGLASAPPPAKPPPIMRAPVPGQVFAGAVDYLDPSAGLRGWVVELDAPGRPVALEVRCAGAVLARAVAMMDRPDIDKLVGRLTQCGFLIGWSRFDAEALARLAETSPDAMLEVVVAATGQGVQVTWGGLPAGRAAKLVTAAPVGDRQRRFREVNEYRDILDSGLFDQDWYVARQGALIEPGLPPLLHYIRHGEPDGRWPNFQFRPRFYARAAQLPSASGALSHYLRNSQVTGVPPGPHFDERWYVARYGAPRGGAALAHYLAHRGDHAPNRWFDPAYYMDVAGEEDLADPFEHFVLNGDSAGLAPSAALEGLAPPEAAAWLDAVRRDAAGEEEAELPAPGPPSATPAPPPRAAQSAAEFLASADLVPPATRIGFAGTEALLGAAPAARRAAILDGCAAILAGTPGRRADAALTLAVARGLAGDRVGAAHAAAAFLSEPAEAPAASRGEIESRLLAANHALHEERRGEEAERVYRLLYAAGRRDWLLLLRLIQTALDRRDLAAAGPLVAEFEQLRVANPSPWGVIALARYDTMRGDRPGAVARLARLPVYPAIDSAAEAAVLNALLEADAGDAATARALRSAPPPTQELFGAHLRVALRRLDLDALMKLLDDPRAERLPAWQLAEAIYVLGAPSRVPLAAQQRAMQRLYPLAEARGTAEPGLIHARSQYLLQTKQWPELGALLASIEGTPLAAHREILLRRLEYHCGTGDFAAAGQLYAAHFQDATLGKWEGLTVLRLLGELGRWAEAARVMVAHVGRGMDFGGATHLALRVVRQAGAHRQVLEAASGVPAAREAGLATFLGFVEEDLAMLRTAEAAEAGLPMTPRIGVFRAAWGMLGAPMAGRGGEAEEFCLVLCTNRRYFLSLLTFLASHLGQSPQVGARIFVFLDRDVPAGWHGTVGMVAARFGREVEVVTEDAFLAADVEHRIGYGFFTGGSQLARTAYFRLYAVRWLMARQQFRRAAYIDTDTIVRGDLSGLFRLNLGDRLVAAATEDYSAEVVVAAARNGLDPHGYFNSGVLVLRLDAPGLAPALEEAIRIAEQESERLVFHDQCALNIAFRGQVQPLPPRYNFYLRPSRERNGFLEDALILHYLDKPKPWDIAFDRGYREEWRVWALLVASVVPQILYIDMLSSANRP